jgi:opacity protein-like surface antigen
MKKLYLLALISFSSLISFSQDTGISAEIHYPIVSTKDYVGDLIGVLGGAFQFQLSDEKKINYGLEYRFDTSQAIQQRENSNIKSKMFVFNHLGAFSKINLDNEEQLKLFVNGGLSVFKYSGGGTSKPYVGFNAGGGLSYSILDQIYIFGKYSLVKASKKQSNSEFTYKETLQIIRFGIGFNI